MAISVDARTPSARIAAKMAVDPDPPAGCEVLLLEDDSVLRRRLVAHLRSLGAEVTEVVHDRGGPQGPRRAAL